MHRIDAADHVANHFSDGDPSTGKLGTKVDAAWLEAVQESLCQFIESMGIALAKGDHTQLGDAVDAVLAAHAVTTNPHGSTAGATPNRIVLRDGNGRARFASPAAAGDAAIYPVDWFQRAPLGQQISASSGSFSATSGPVDVTNLSVAISTHARPVFVGLISDGSGSPNDAYIGTGNTAFDITILRDAAEIARHRLPLNSQAPVGSVWHVDLPAVGTHTYKAQITGSPTSPSYCSYAKLIAYEL